MRSIDCKHNCHIGHRGHQTVFVFCSLVVLGVSGTGQVWWTQSPSFHLVNLYNPTNIDWYCHTNSCLLPMFSIILEGVRKQPEGRRSLNFSFTSFCLLKTLIGNSLYHVLVLQLSLLQGTLWVSSQCTYIFYFLLSWSCKTTLVSYWSPDVLL